MAGSGPTVRVVQDMLQTTHLPASMNGNVYLYITTLTAMMCGTVLGIYVVGWMGRDIIRDRNHAKFKSVLFNFRLMMLLVGFAAVMACLPETLYLQMYGDPKVSTETQAAVMTGKRIADSARIYVIIGWVSLLTMIYPYVCLALVEHDDKRMIRHLQVEDYPGLYRLIKPATVFLLLAAVSVAFAISKVYHP